MRRLSAALVALSAATALSALSAPAWAAPAKAKPKPQPVREWPLAVSPSEVHSGQTVTVSGRGCQASGALSLQVNGQEFYRGSAKSGTWSYPIKLPSGLRSGEHNMTAQCKGAKHTPARFHVVKNWKWRGGGSFNVNDDVVIAGDKVWVEGNGCKKRTVVVISLNGKPIKALLSDRYGSFDKKVRVPKWVPRGRHVFSAYCGRHLGYDVIKVKNPYRQHKDYVKFHKNRVRPGQWFQVDGDDCPGGKPYGYFNGKPVNMNSSRKGKGFTANAVIPKGTPAGIHKFSAGCEGGSKGNTNLYVEDDGDGHGDGGYPWVHGASQAPGSRPTSDLAMWAGLFVGIALLVASTLITTRRRRNHG
jgi:hypothetical protein